MVNFIQPKVSPLPTGTDFTGKTAVITGASAGLGREVTRQLLRLRASTVILGVRNIAKGEACAETLRQECGIQTDSPRPTIKVMELDMDRYDSVQRFTKQLREEIPVVDLLIVNAGIGLWKLERSPSGHERTIQVNYYSNVLDCRAPAVSRGWRGDDRLPCAHQLGRQSRTRNLELRQGTHQGE
jgi:NAD(P)-dependent dehydrogenase (short-subunit alcohol dehydrogenase family)